jgi:hypothetical protein
MQFTFDAQRQEPDLARLESVIAELDPAAVLDLDASGRIVRMSTVLRQSDVLACLEAAGMSPGPGQLRQLPSQCCGGCSG